MEWRKKAVERGKTFADYSLGSLYRRDLDAEQNHHSKRTVSFCSGRSPHTVLLNGIESHDHSLKTACKFSSLIGEYPLYSPDYVHFCVFAGHLPFIRPHRPFETSTADGDVLAFRDAAVQRTTPFLRITLAYKAASLVVTRAYAFCARS